MLLELANVRSIANRYGFGEVFFNERSRLACRLVSFCRRYVGHGEEGYVRVNVYYTTGTVGTCLDHPRQGSTQLFRRKCTAADLHAIFSDPRVHTGKGYQQDATSKEGGGGNAKNAFGLRKPTLVMRRPNGGECG